MFVVLIFLFFVIFILLIVPPHIFCINSAALINPSSIEFGSMPLSNLYFASVSKFKIFVRISN